MSWLKAAFFSAALALVLPCAAQALSVKELEQSLASGKPREVAWAAYTIAQEKRQELIPNLSALVASYQEIHFDGSAVPLEVAAMEAVADALIQLNARLPAGTVMHLYPQFPAQTIILLSRASDNAAPLLEIFRTTLYRDLSLAAGNLLLTHPPPGFARALMEGFTSSFRFEVVAPAERATRSEGGEACASDSYMSREEAFLDWPKARMYALVTHGAPLNVFAPGIHPVGFRYWATTDYREAWTDGDCTPASSINWRAGLLAQLQGQNLEDFPLKPTTRKLTPYLSPASFQDGLKAVIDEQSQAFANVVESFVQSGSLTVQDSTEVHLQCRIEIQDERPQPRTPLPEIEGKWCETAPPRLKDIAHGLF